MVLTFRLPPGVVAKAEEHPPGVTAAKLVSAAGSVGAGVRVGGKRMSAFAGMMTFLVTLSFALPIAAQVPACPTNQTLGYGIATIDCVNCTVQMSGARPWMVFSTEPTVREVVPDAPPTAPQFLRGDVIVSIDGTPIVTRAGSAALAAPVANRAARFEVRRDGRVIALSIAPRCYADDSADPAKPGNSPDSNSAGASSLARVGRLENVATIAGAGARGVRIGSGHLDFAFQSVSMTTFIDAAGTMHIAHKTYPTVSRVIPGGPADLGGMKVGDTVRAVDGIPLTTPAGTKRLSSIMAGTSVTLTVMREGKLIELSVIARGGSR